MSPLENFPMEIRRVLMEGIRKVHSEIRAGRIAEAWTGLTLVIGVLSPYVEEEAEFQAWLQGIGGERQ
jgi:hypothetical protein